MAISSRCSVRAAEPDIISPPFLFLTCQKIQGDSQPSIKSMSQKIMYLVDVYSFAGTSQFRCFEECMGAEQLGRSDLDCRFIVEASFPLPFRLESCDQ